MKSQPIKPKPTAKRPTYIDLQPPPKDSQNMRTVIFVEMGAMDSKQFALVAAKFATEFSGPARGDHYFCPVQNGEIKCDPFFEAEFLEIVHKTCEVKNGEIVLKGNVTPIRVIREFVN